MRVFFVVISLCSLIACTDPVEPVHKTKILSFGTYVDVSISGVNKQQASIAIQRIEQELDYMHQQWHAWRPSSITQLNAQLQSQKEFQIQPDLLPLLIQSKLLYRRSNGYFNPAIGKLIELWGFYKDDPQSNLLIPETKAIESLLNSSPNMDDIIIQDNLVRGSNPHIQIDFGGYAKGFGVEQLVKQLRANNISNALINAGGDIKAIGSVINRPWKIAIQNPHNSSPLGWVNLNSNESIFSSGDYQRFFEYQGKRYHHIINPKTGYPSSNAKAVTVITEDAAEADAAATALMVAPKAEWFSLAKKLQLDHVLIVDSSGKLYCDDLFAKRLQLVEQQQLNLLGSINPRQNSGT